MTFPGSQHGDRISNPPPQALGSVSCGPLQCCVWSLLKLRLRGCHQYLQIVLDSQVVDCYFLRSATTVADKNSHLPFSAPKSFSPVPTTLCAGTHATPHSSPLPPPSHRNGRMPCGSSHVLHNLSFGKLAHCFPFSSSHLAAFRDGLPAQHQQGSLRQTRLHPALVL